MNFSGTTTYFLETQQIFDDVKRVFHLGTNAGLEPFNAFFQTTQCNDTRFGIHTNMSLHAKVPEIPLLGLMHLRITFPALVFGGRRGDGGIHHRAFLQQQPLVRQMGVDGCKDSLRQTVGFQKAPKLEQGGGIRALLPAQVHPHESPEWPDCRKWCLPLLHPTIQSTVGQCTCAASAPNPMGGWPRPSFSLGIERFQFHH